MAYGISNYLRNKLVDNLLRGVAYTAPATYYVRLVTSTPSATVNGTEVSGGSYAPVAINKSTTAWAATNADGSTANPSTGTSGKTSNIADIVFPTPSANWGTVTHWELWDAATGGNRHFFGEITDAAGNPSAIVVLSGVPVKFPAASLAMYW